VLLFVDQTIVNGTNSKKRTERNRVLMTMVHRDGRWIVDDVALR
jgi:Mce-associated membrane protein